MDDPVVAAINKSLAKIDQMHKQGVFSTFIDAIHFPKYRSFDAASTLAFDYPITALVGQNGTGKTSILRALESAPGGKSLGNWWFGTVLDPTDPEQPNATSDNPEVSKKRVRRPNLPTHERAAFWYEYKHEGVTRQVLKTRVRTKGEPDYWEPSRPVQMYGMQRKGESRDPTITMNSIYINIRYELNAFDKCFWYHSSATLQRFERLGYWKKQGLELPSRAKSRNRPRPARIQDYLRFCAIKLKRAFEQTGEFHHAAHLMAKPKAVLSNDHLETIKSIIGRDYASIESIEHRFYERWGHSVRFRTPGPSYTEAFAGSGEGVVVLLVRKILEAPDHSLILLDEPETSLHPGAQRKLLAFILEQIIRKKLQVVISTHSPTFVQYLPPKAIKVLTADASGTVRVIPDCKPEEAFFFIGHHHGSQTILLVEDILAKNLVERVLTRMGDAVRSRFLVEYRPGGASGLVQEIATLSLTGSAWPFVLLDGDQKPLPDGDVEFSPVDPDTLSVETCNDPAKLDAIIQHQSLSKIQFVRKDSNMSVEREAEPRIRYLKYFHRRVRYLPFLFPEMAIWNDDAAESVIRAAIGDAETVAAHVGSIKKIADYKDRFAHLKEFCGTSAVGDLHNIFINRFIESESVALGMLKDLLGELHNSHA